MNELRSIMPQHTKRMSVASSHCSACLLCLVQRLKSEGLEVGAYLILSGRKVTDKKFFRLSNVEVHKQNLGNLLLVRLGVSGPNVGGVHVTAVYCTDEHRVWQLQRRCQMECKLALGLLCRMHAVFSLALSGETLNPYLPIQAQGIISSSSPARLSNTQAVTCIVWTLRWVVGLVSDATPSMCAVLMPLSVHSADLTANNPCSVSSVHQEPTSC